MRIVSGTHRGRRISAPTNLPSRPTTDMAKEAIFNILSNRFNFYNVSVLDLFAGTGNLSYEFASRGVEKITAIDKDRKCIGFIQATAEKLDMPINALLAPVEKYLSTVREEYDIIIADPPYDYTEVELQTLIDLVMPVLSADGLLALEHSKHKSVESHPAFVEARKYGSSLFSLFPKV